LAAPEIEIGAMVRRSSATVTVGPLIVLLLVADIAIENNPNRG
jgi:hypothetical protein